MSFLNAQDVMTFVLIGSYALDAELARALVTKRLDRLHVLDVLIAELLDDTLLVDQRFI